MYLLKIEVLIYYPEILLVVMLDCPARLGWEPVVKINHYHVGADIILQQGMKDEK